MITDGKINEITLNTLGQWPSFEAQSWACKVVKAVLTDPGLSKLEAYLAASQALDTATDNLYGQDAPLEDCGPWIYVSDPEAEAFVHRSFLESVHGPHDVRLYVNGNFGDEEQRAAYAAMLATKLNRPAPVPDEGPDFVVAEDADLNELLNAVADYASGKPQNHDSIVYMYVLLSRVLTRLHTSQPVEDAPQVTDEPGEVEPSTDAYHAGLPTPPESMVLGFDREDHDIVGYTLLQLRDYAMKAVIQTLQNVQVFGCTATQRDIPLEVHGYSAVDGRRTVLVITPDETPQALDDARIRAIFLANGFTIKEGLEDLKPYVYQAAYALIDAAKADLTNPANDGLWTLIAPDGRQWRRVSALQCAAAEQRERIPAETALKRILEAADAAMDEAAHTLLEEQPTGQVYGIIDPDYGRFYTMIRKLAWEEGYAIGLHGSFTRDLDLIAVPWEQGNHNPDKLIARIVQATGLNNLHSNPGTKPYGRLVWTLTLPDFGDPRFIDLSILPIQANENPV